MTDQDREGPEKGSMTDGSARSDDRDLAGEPGAETQGPREAGESGQEEAPTLVHPRRVLSHPVKVLLVIGGFVSFIVGIIGLLIPVFPTSPFIILAAALFFRGSDRWYEWILNHRWFGRYVRDYRERGGMARIPKYSFLATVWIAVGVSTVVVLDDLWPRIFLLAFGAALSTWVLRLKTL